MTPIWGYDAVVSLIVDSVPYPVFCSTDMEFRLKQDVVLATTASTGSYRQKRLRGLCEWSITTSGLTKIDNSDGQISFFYLLQEAIRGQVQKIQIDFTDAEGNDQTIAGSVIIPDLSINSPASDWSSASVTFEGSGAISMIPVEPPVPSECEQEDTLYIDAVENETSVHHDLLEQAGVVILAVARTGAVHHQTSGTPSGIEFQTDLPNGDIHFDPTNPFGTNEWVAVEYKIQT